MQFSVRYSKQATKDLPALPVSMRRRVLERMTAYSQSPEAPQHDVIRLVGTDEYRLRVGDWRVVFVIAGNQIEVRRISDRREAYR